jgi:ubiquinone/menaquinone biosynthesis C-methylase UbiE
MSIIQADARNADQIAYWNGPAGKRWADRQEDQDSLLEPISAATIARAAVRTGESVIDVGCGAGATAIELGRIVGSTGRVLGIDVSEPMLARAAARLPKDLPVELVRADATMHHFPPASFNLLFSRFGVMFFADPARTFANLRSALRRGGRLAFACWRKPEENLWVMLPLRAAYEHVPPLPKVGPEEPGLFSFASEGRVHRVLSEAGFQAIRLEPLDFEFDVARGRGLDEAVANAMTIGPASRAIEGQPAEILQAAAASVRRAFTQYQRGSMVPLSAAVWIVTATNP